MRRRIAWEYPSEARPNDGEQGRLRAARRGGGSLVMVELLVARLGQEMRKNVSSCLWKLNARKRPAVRLIRPGPRTRGVYV